MAEEQIIELTTVKKSNKKFIIVLAVAILMLLAAVAFLVLYLLKPAAQIDNTPKVYNVTFSSGNLFTRPTTGGSDTDGKTENLASVGHKYELFFDIDVVSGDVSTAVRYSCSPQDALKSVEIEPVASEVSESADTITQRYKVTFEAESAYADGITPVTLNVYSVADTAKAASVVFKVAKINTQFMSLSGKVNAEIKDNSVQTIEIPAYVDDKFNTLWQTTISQFGESNGDLNGFASVSSVFDPNTSRKSDDIQLEVVSGDKTYNVDEGSSIDLGFVTIALDDALVKFKAGALVRSGDAKITVKANVYNEADVVSKSFNLVVAESDNSKFNYVTEIKYSEDVVTYSNLDTVATSDVITLVASDDTYVITDHIFVNPVSVMFDENGEVIDGWHKNLTFTAGNSSMLRINQSGASVRFTPSIVGSTTLTITDTTPGAPNVSVTLDVVILAQIQRVTVMASRTNNFTDYSGNTPMLTVNANSGSTVYMCVAYRVALRNEDYTNNVVLDYMNSAFTIRAQGKLADYLNVEAPLEFSKEGGSGKFAFGDIAHYETVATQAADNTSMYVIVTFTIKLSDDIPSGEYTLSYDKIGVPYGTAENPDRTSDNDSTSTTNIKIVVTGNASSFSYKPIDDIKAYIDANDAYSVHDAVISNDLKTLTLVLNTRSGNAFSLNDLFIPNVLDADINISYSVQSGDGVSIGNGSNNTVRGMISFKDNLEQTSFRVTATNSMNSPISGDYTLIIEPINSVSSIVSPSTASYTYSSSVSSSKPLTIIRDGDVSLIYRKSETEKVVYRNADIFISIPVLGENGVSTLVELDVTGEQNKSFSYTHNGAVYKLFSFDSALHKIDLVYDLAAFYLKTGIAVNDIHIEFGVDSSISEAQASTGYKYNTNISRSSTNVSFERTLDGFAVYEDSALTKAFVGDSVVMGPDTSTILYLVPTIKAGDVTVTTSELNEVIALSGVKTEKFAAAFSATQHFTVATTTTSESLGVAQLTFTSAESSPEGAKATLLIRYNAFSAVSRTIDFSINRSVLKVADIKLDSSTLEFSSVDDTKTVKITVTYQNNDFDAYTFEEIKIQCPAWLTVSSDVIVNPSKKPIKNSTNEYTAEVTFNLVKDATQYAPESVQFKSTSGAAQSSVAVSAKTQINTFAPDNFDTCANVATRPSINGYVVKAESNSAPTKVIGFYTPVKTSTAYPVDMAYVEDSLQVNGSANANITATGAVKDGVLRVEILFAAGTPAGIYTVSYALIDNVSGNKFTYSYVLQLVYEIYSITPDQTSLDFTTDNSSPTASTSEQEVTLTFNNSQANFAPERLSGDIELGYVKKGDVTGSTFAAVSSTFEQSFKLMSVFNGNATVGFKASAVMTTVNFDYDIMVRVASNHAVFAIINLSVINTDRQIDLVDDNDNSTSITIGTRSDAYTFDVSDKFRFEDKNGIAQAYTPTGNDALTYKISPNITGVSVDNKGVVTFGSELTLNNSRFAVVAEFTKQSSGKKTSASYNVAYVVEFDAVLSGTNELVSADLFIGETRKIESRAANNFYKNIVFNETINVVVASTDIVQYTSENSSFKALKVGSTIATFTVASNSGVRKEIGISVKEASFNAVKWGSEGSASKTYDVSALLNADALSVDFAISATVNLPLNATITGVKLNYISGNKPTAFVITDGDLSALKLTLNANDLTAADYASHTLELAVTVSCNGAEQTIKNNLVFICTFGESLSPVVEVYYGNEKVSATINKSYANSYTAKLSCENTKHGTYALDTDSSSVIAVGERITDGFALTLGGLGSATLTPKLTVFGKTFEGSGAKYTVQDDQSLVLGATVSETNVDVSAESVADINHALSLDKNGGSAAKTVYIYINIDKFAGNYSKTGVVISSSSSIAVVTGAYSEVTINGKKYIKQGVVVSKIGAFTLTATVRDLSGVAYSIPAYAVSVTATAPEFSASGDLSVVCGNNIAISTSATRNITDYNITTSLSNSTGFNTPSVNAKNITVTTTKGTARNQSVLTVVYTVNSGVFAGQSYTYTYNLISEPAVIAAYTGKTENASISDEYTFSSLFTEKDEGNVTSVVAYEVIGFGGLTVGTDYTLDTASGKITFNGRTLNNLRGFVVTVKLTVKNEDYGLTSEYLSYLTVAPTGITISYNGNGNDAENDPMDMTTSATYADVNILLETNTFTRTHYTFGGWSTTAGGDVAFGSSFTANAVYTNDKLTLYAVWNPKTYMVSFNSMGGSAVSSQSYVYNDKPFEVNAADATPTRENFKFGGWYTKATCFDADKYVPTVLTGDIVLYAKWNSETNHKITVNVENAVVTLGEGAANGNATHGGTFEFTVAANTGYIITSVNVTSALLSEPTGSNAVTYVASEVAGAVTITVKTAKISYVVTLDYNFDDTKTTLNVLYNEFAPKPINDPVRAGYAFKGWRKLVDGQPSGAEFSWTTEAITENTTVQAQWAKLYTVTFNAANANVSITSGGTLSGNSIVLEENAELKFTVAANTGYTLGEVKNGTTTIPDDSGVYTVKVTADTQINVTTTINNYTVTANVGIDNTDNSKCTLNGVPGNANHFSEFTFTAAPITGYHVSNVTATGGTVTMNADKTSITVSNVSGNVIITVTVAINKYNFTVIYGNGTQDATTQIDYNKKYSKPTDPIRTGYTFYGWYIVEGGKMTTELYNFDSSVTADVTVQAKWVKQYTVTLSNGGSVYEIIPIGYDKNGSYIFDEASIFRFAVKPGLGKKITNVTYGGEKVEVDSLGVYSITVTKDGTIAVTTETTTHTVTFTDENSNPLQNCTVTTDPASLQSVNYGGSFTFTITLSDGYRVMNVTVIGANYEYDSANSCYKVSSVNGDVKVEITLSNEYNVTFSLGYDGAPSIAAQSIVYNQSATEPNKPLRAGYSFKGWFVGEATEAYEFTSAVTADISLTAKWEKQLTVTYTVSAGIKIDFVGDSEADINESSVISRTYDKGSKIRFKYVLIDGYNFVSITGAEYKDEAYEITVGDVNVDVEVSATLKTYTVLASGNIGALTDGKITYSKAPTHGKPFSFTLSLKEGYRLKAVIVTNGGTLVGVSNDGVYYVENVTGDITITVTASNEYTVTFVGKNSSETKTVTYNTAVTKPGDPTSDGYAFRGWTLGGAVFNFNTPITQDITLYSTWVSVYKVTFPVFANATVKVSVAGGTGKDVGSGGSFEIASDETAVITVSPDTHYSVASFAYVSGQFTLNSDGEYVLTNVFASGTLTFKVSPPEYKVYITCIANDTATVSAEPESGFTIENGVITKVKAGERSFTVTAEDGYSISSVLVNGTTLDPSSPTSDGNAGAIKSATYSTIVKGDISIIIITAPVTYTITFVAYPETNKGNEHMTVTNTNITITDTNATTFTHGVDNVLVAPTRPGYTFMGFIEDGKAAVKDFNTKTYTSNITLTATWEAIKYTITYDWGTTVDDDIMKLQLNLSKYYPIDYTVEEGNLVKGDQGYGERILVFGDLNASNGLGEAFIVKNSTLPFELETEAGTFVSKYLDYNTFYGNITAKARYEQLTSSVLFNAYRYGTYGYANTYFSAYVNSVVIQTVDGTTASQDATFKLVQNYSTSYVYPSYRLRVDSGLQINIVGVNLNNNNVTKATVSIYVLEKITNSSSQAYTSNTSTTTPGDIRVGSYSNHKEYTVNFSSTNGASINIPKEDMAELKGKCVAVFIGIHGDTEATLPNGNTPKIFST